MPLEIYVRTEQAIRSEAVRVEELIVSIFNYPSLRLELHLSYRTHKLVIKQKIAVLSKINA